MSLKPKQVDFTDVWTKLRSTAEAVITLDKVDRAVWNMSFSDVYTLCVAQPEPMADKLYMETKEFLENHVTNMLAKRVSGNANDALNLGNEDLLQRYYDAWKQYSKGIRYLHSLYSYLNHQHIKKQKITDTETFYGNLAADSSEQMEIGELGLDIWRVYMVETLSADLVQYILDGIDKDRLGNPPLDRQRVATINGVIHSFVEVQNYKRNGTLKLYEELFEQYLLEASGTYYTREANKLLEHCTVSQYLEEVIKLLEDEGKRAVKFLHWSSLPKLRKHCEEKFIHDRLDFIYSECTEMVANERRADLRNMYIILKPIPDNLKGLLIQTFLEHIKNEGLKTVADLKGENVHIQFVENMLKVHQKYLEIIADVFENDSLFLSALDKACASVINRRPKENDRQPCRSAEYVAKYCDTLLKKSKSCENETDLKLANNITIFKYIEDKDVYQKFYSRLLAKRLIHEQSQSMDAEEAMINRLKQACGYEFTNKLHRMFTDISLSADLNNKFSSYLKTENINLDINLSIKVLQAGAWPLGSTQVIPFAVPQEFEKAIRLFEAFYHKSFSGRKLTWLHHMCHGELKMVHLSKVYIVTMQTYQMAMLLLFEACDSLTCREIQSTLQLNAETFQKHLQSLIESKLLTASSENLDGDTRVDLNLDYTNKRTKFKISSALQKETPQEVEHTINSVDDDRKLFLQAAIVRIMKARKCLKHNALIQEVLSLSQVSFTPNIAMIKKCIESLIDKQYIERTANSGDEYSYVA